jgi:hypothetical protein
MGVVDGGRLRDLRESAFELMILNLNLTAPMFGIQSTGAPSFPTAVDFFAALP